jgi:glycosyltransferase involved in cell wall biosynthesis
MDYLMNSSEAMGGSSPLVSILVPSYNHASYIAERIQSIVNQTYKNFELIVIDDRSSDESSVIISKLRDQYGFQFFTNAKNSGTPFSAWQRICEMAKGEFIWICESDDVAEPTFLETAVLAFSKSPDASMFYCSSLIINERSEKIGHTDSYFRDVWKETRWSESFKVDGADELAQFQVRGQIVPNMSSAMFRATAFRAAFSPFLLKLKLTGDWLFVGDVLKQGNSVFEHAALSQFRKHEITARAQVRSARSQAEFILTKYRLFTGCRLSVGQFASVMSSDMVRFLYEPDPWFKVAGALLKVSWWDTVKCFGLLAVSVARNKSYIGKFKDRYVHSKEWHLKEREKR